jgi:predicted transcriptional regulator
MVPEIMADILLFCKDPQPKTRIMYNSNLSYRMLERYLGQLLSFGLLEIHRRELKYMSTTKGFEFVAKWASLMDLLAQSEEHKGPLVRAPVRVASAISP